MSHPPPIDDLASFLTAYKSHTHALKTTKIDQFRAGFNKLAPTIQAFQAQVQEHNRATAATFNLFHLLGIAGKEVETHSRLLADWLNPRGRHAQGYLFLETFLEMCQQQALPYPPATTQFPLLTNIRQHRWQIYTEMHTSYGRMDIVLLCRALNCALVIENKIWAGEQDDQLGRYARWLAERQTEYPQQALIFLTPAGHAAATHQDAPYFRLSYHKDIVTWLTAAQKSIQATRLTAVLDQYIEVIRTI